MITPLLKSSLAPIVARHRMLRTLRWCAIGLLVVAGLAAAFSISLLIVFALAIVAVWAATRYSDTWEPDYVALARQIEQRHPELHALLLTAVEQEPDPTTGRLSYLQQRVLADAVKQAGQHQWLDAVPGWQMAAHYAAVAAVLGLVIFSASTQRSKAAARQLAGATAPQHDGVEITPGDAAIERGSGLVVLASFGRDVPGDAKLVIRPQNEEERQIQLVKNLDDPVFGGGLPEVTAPLTYRVEYDGKATRDFIVTVFEHPRLERADATLHFPEYTKLPERQILDTRRVSGVEGTKLNVAFQLNKRVKSAALVGRDGTRVPLEIEEGKAAVALRDFPVQTSDRYELELKDEDGRASKTAAHFHIEALPNRRPELKFATPRGDQRLTPLQEVTFTADAWDDFGLARYGLTVNVAGRGEQHFELGAASAADERRTMSHVLKLEELGVKPDELVSWFIWAEDLGPSGQPRRTASDMFFGEVRPFEEIYRQGDEQDAQRQQQQQQQGGGGNEATKLADLQKQIITATWNLQRAEEAVEKSPSEKYLKDHPVVRDSQEQALEMTTELAEKIEEPKSLAFADIAMVEMQKALDRLIEATKEPKKLPEALSAEQSAYNALLKLAAHEYRVTRNRNQQQGGGGGEQRNQQQLDQLELKEDKQRYETQREAAPQQNEQQREQLGILNRLKELAQRQQDINERVKELQTALQAAQSEKEKEEIRRQLKRLSEEEQELLADIDETRQKMEESPQQSELAEERRKLDETRAEAQKAAEALEQQQATQALASGARAARQLQEMRDEFRKKASGQFNDDMRQMRADARELAENQQEIADQLKTESGKPERRTLDGSGEREQLAQQFEKQRTALGEITEEMKRVSEEAEVAEPLLAKELYDALRKTAQAETGRKLELTQQLAERGYSSQAEAFETKAREEIEELKSGVERAAESVLGDEAEALRQARAELDALSEQLNREIARAQPQLADARDAGSRNSQSAAGEEESQRGAPGSQSAGEEPREGEEGEARERGQAAGEQNQEGQRARQNGQRSDRGERGGQQEGEQGEGGERPGQEEGEGEAREGESNERRQMAQNQQGQQRGQGQRQQQGQRGERGQQGEQGEEGGEGQEEGQGQQPGQRPGQSGRGQTAQRGQQQGEAQQGGEQGEQQGQGQQGQGQQGQGQQGQGGQRAGGGGGRGGETADAAQDSPGDQQAREEEARRGQRLADIGNPRRERTGSEAGGGGPSSGGGELEPAGPLTGEDFAAWADRLRNVEEMVDDPGIRSEVARVRELARGVRVEFKRHSVPPNWEMVKTKIGDPLAQLRDRVTEELARRGSKENLTPIDRDPVPNKYAERVRRYYEELGRSK